MPNTPALAVACVALAGCLATAGCASDRHVRLPHSPEEATGTVTVVLTQAATDLTVAINGTLVAERAHTKKVRVDGVPVGIADVDIAAGGGPERVERRVRVLVDPSSTISIPVGAPEKSMGSAMKMGSLTILAYVLSRAIIWAL